jgi:hypothetical protein
MLKRINKLRDFFSSADTRLAGSPVNERTTMSSQRVTEVRSCACGCDCIPVRGEFCPGHDAKLRSKFLCRIDNGDAKAIQEYLNDWPTLADQFNHTEAKMRARLGQGCKHRRQWPYKCPWDES